MSPVLLDVLYTVGLTLGVGSSTFAVIFYIQILNDGVIDASEKRLMRTVYILLRVGMALIGLALVGNIFFPIETIPQSLVAWTLLCVITLNAILMTYRLMPMRYGPVLAGGSWYTLFLVSRTPIQHMEIMLIAVVYILILAFFSAVFKFLLDTYTIASYGGEVTHDQTKLKPYANDASSFTVIPKAVYYPKTTADIRALINLCVQERSKGADASLTVRAGGTCMSGGALTNSWVVDMTKYMKNISIDPKQMTATVEMGAYFRDIEDAAKKYNLMFAPYPSSRRICGIGGMIGNNASGEKSLRNGATSDNVLELEVLLADGTLEVIHPKKVSSVTSRRGKELLELYNKHGAQLKEATGEVKKSASGYRLEKLVSQDTFSEIPLIVGAQGTLGIVVRAVLKLTPIPQYTELMVISGKSLADIPEIINTITKHNPEGLETFDIHTFEKAKEHLTVHANRLLPYIDEKAHLFILAQFSESTQEETAQLAEQCFSELNKHGFNVQRITKPEDIASAWEVRRNSFLLMRDHNPENQRAVPCIEDVIVPLSAIGAFVTELRKILKKRTTHYGYHGHIGDGSLRIIPVFDFTSPTVSDDILGLMEEVFALVKSLKGNISADHSDGIIRTPFLQDFYGKELYEVFDRIKHLYDPHNIMNPYKKVGGTREHIKQHLST